MGSAPAATPCRQWRCSTSPSRTCSHSSRSRAASPPATTSPWARSVRAGSRWRQGLTRIGLGHRGERQQKNRFSAVAEAALAGTPQQPSRGGRALVGGILSPAHRIREDPRELRQPSDSLLRIGDQARRCQASGHLLLMFLLDTTALSALRRSDRAHKVAAWLSSRRDQDLFLSVISIGEIVRGVRQRRPVILPLPAKCALGQTDGCAVLRPPVALRQLGLPDLGPVFGRDRPSGGRSDDRCLGIAPLRPASPVTPPVLRRPACIWRLCSDRARRMPPPLRVGAAEPRMRQRPLPRFSSSA